MGIEIERGMETGGWSDKDLWRESKRRGVRKI